MLLLLSTFASAQFGGNKVQYGKKEWSYIRSAHFDIYFTEKSRRIASFAADELERSLRLISKDIHYNIKKRIPVIIYKSHSDFEQTNVILDDIGEGTGGFTELVKSRIVVPFSGSFKDFRHVLHHELVHGVMFDLMFEGVLNALRARASFHIPLWAAEGLAEYESAGWNLESDMFLMDAVISGYISEPREEFGSLYLAYKAGMAFYNFLAVQYGPQSVGDFIKYLTVYKDVEKAFLRATHADLKNAGARFLLDCKKKYWPELGRRETAGEVAKRLTLHRPAGYFAPRLDEDPLAHMNMQPAVSPDGNTIAYFSDRGDFDAIYLMDSRSGRILKKLAEAGSSGQFESFHTFSSGIGWSSDSKNIIFVSKADGQDLLRIMEVKSGKMKKSLPCAMDAIESPQFSPDNKKVVFAGMRDAVSDIFIFDLQNGRLNRLTADPAFDSRPRFSWDGKWIVFESEVGDTAEKGCNNFDLFLIRPDGTELTRLTHDPFDDRMACFSTDNKSLYFISNRSGVSNLYGMALDSLLPHPVTNLFTGCFTPSLPQDGRFIAFTVFENGGWDIYRMEEPQKKARDTALPLTAYALSLQDSGRSFWEKYAVLPDPADTVKKSGGRADSLKNDSGRVADTLTTADTVRTDTTAQDEEEPDRMTLRDPMNSFYNDDPFVSRPRRRPEKARVDTSAFLQDSVAYKNPNGAYREAPYEPRFSVDAVSAMIGAGFSPSQSAIMGQTAIALSDVLGNHHLQLMLNLSGTSIENTLDGLSGYAAYYYLPYQADVGVSLYRYVNIFGDEPVPLLRYDIYYDAVQNAALDVSYPFSKFFRLESDVGVTWINRSVQRYVRESAAQKDYESLGRFPEKTMTHYNIDGAAVFDNTLWGAVGPVNGQRLRVGGGVVPKSASSEYGYGYGYADLRRYFHYRKWYSLALRLTGGGSTDIQGGRNPMRFYLGGTPGNLRYFFAPYLMDNSIESNYFSSLIMPLRGYSLGAANPEGSNHFLLSNMEFRFPVVNNITFFFPFTFTIPYMMGALFWDIGGAWDDPADFRAVVADKGSFTFHDIKSGLGFGLRMNLFGALVLKWDHAYRLGEHHLSEDYFSLGAEF